jgi:hypothetical protein
MKATKLNKFIALASCISGVSLASAIEKRINKDKHFKDNLKLVFSEYSLQKKTIKVLSTNQL